MVRTLRFLCRGCKFDPWLGNQDPACRVAWSGNKREVIDCGFGSDAHSDSLG